MSPYAFGTRSDATRTLQQALASGGFYQGPVDGIFGRLTEGAVSVARQRFGLHPGGVDVALLMALGLAAPPAPRPSIFARIAGAILISKLKGLLPMTFLSGYKTYIVAAAMLLAGISGLLGLDIPSFTGQAPGDLVMQALAFFFLRQGLKTDLTKS